MVIHAYPEDYLYTAQRIMGDMRYEVSMDSENPLTLRFAGFRRCYSYLKE
ncbi:MAG: hypothetical protein K1W34_19270 [Lachnospiraceae bacterium]